MKFIVILITQLFHFISVFFIFLKLSLFLCLQLSIQIYDLLLESFLMISMILIILMNFLANRLNMNVKFTSNALWFVMHFGSISNILLMIINDSTFTIQWNKGCFQSFNFNFLFRNFNLSTMKLFLLSKACIIWYLWVSSSRWSAYLFSRRTFPNWTGETLSLRFHVKENRYFEE